MLKLLLLLLSHFSSVRLFPTPWTAAYQAPLSTGFSRQEYLSGVPLPSLHYWPHYYTANRREKVEAMTDILFLVSKITEDGDCTHEIK